MFTGCAPAAWRSVSSLQGGLPYSTPFPKSRSTKRLLVQIELDLPTSPRVVKPVLSSTDVLDLILG